MEIDNRQFPNSPSPGSRAWFLGCAAAAVLSALVALGCMTRELDKPMLGPHSFRQTQTAISAFYMAQDPAMFFDYITPVLGPPWRIPMELPVYQWIVARWHNLTGMLLDPSGKLISIAAWLLCLVPLWSIGRSLRLPRKVLALSTAIALASPLYLFWGAAFLIETTGLFFALCMVACALRAREFPSWKWLLLAVIAGSLAATVKATTWAVAAGTGLLLILVLEGIPRLADWKKITLTAVAMLIPLLPGKLWLAYGDALKQANPFARELIIASSPNQSAWNFGTIQQKLNPATWEHIWRHITEQLFVPAPLLGPLLLPTVLIAGAALAPRRIPAMLALLAGFVAGPVIFTNLYFEHSYYWCANGVWFLAAVGIALAGIWEFRPRAWWPKALVIGLTVAACLSGFLVWRARFLPVLESIPSREQLEQAWTKPVQAVVPPGRTILIVGNDWNPNSLYYCGRKGMAFPTFKTIPFPGPQLEESLANLAPHESLGAVVVNPATLNSHPEVFEKFLKDHGFSLSGQTTPFGILFPAPDLKFGSLPGS